MLELLRISLYGYALVVLVQQISVFIVQEQAWDRQRPAGAFLPYLFSVYVYVYIPALLKARCTFQPLYPIAPAIHESAFHGVVSRRRDVDCESKGQFVKVTVFILILDL